MQFELNRLTDYSDESLISELQEVAKKVNASKLTVKLFDENSKVNSTTIRRRFGSWGKALEKANLTSLFDDSNKTRSKQKIIDELHCVSKKIGNTTITRELFNEYSKYGYAAVRSTFGSWSNALQEANLQQTKHAKRYTDEECFENLLEVWTYYGRQPKHQEMKQEPSKVGAKAYISRWGSWTKALYAFVERVNSDSSDSVISTAPVTEIEKPDLKNISSEDKRDIRLGLRYDVLKRDSFKCVICGQSPATNHNTTLHIDHIVPFSKGGKTNSENLRTLCKDCNLGKSDKI